MIKCGGKGIRTPDFQLAKLALYQLSYAPRRNCRISIADFRLQGRKENAGCRSYESASGFCALRTFARFGSGPVLLPYCPPAGTAKYAINAPVAGSIALPVISPLLFMSFAFARKAE